MLREPPPLVSFDNITSARKRVIQKASSVIRSVPSPRPFQVVGAHRCAYNGDTYLAVICRTADGKYLIPQILGSLWLGVCIYLVPLIRLFWTEEEQKNKLK